MFDIQEGNNVTAQKRKVIMFYKMFELTLSISLARTTAWLDKLAVPNVSWLYCAALAQCDCYAIPTR